MVPGTLCFTLIYRSMNVQSRAKASARAVCSRSRDFAYQLGAVHSGHWLSV